MVKKTTTLRKVQNRNQMYDRDSDDGKYCKVIISASSNMQESTLLPFYSHPCVILLADVNIFGQPDASNGLSYSKM